MTAFAINIAFLIATAYIRYSHEGRVCSGDYLYDSGKTIFTIFHDNKDSQNGQMLYEGLLLTCYIYTGFIQCFIVVIVSSVDCCTTPGEYSPDKERDM